MEIRFDCECYERTLVVVFHNRYHYLREDILEDLDQYYNEWIFVDSPYGEEVHDMCLEEYLMHRLSENYDMWTEWYVEED